MDIETQEMINFCETLGYGDLIRQLLDPENYFKTNCKPQMSKIARNMGVSRKRVKQRMVRLMEILNEAGYGTE